jgi:hypothetical protein
MPMSVRPITNAMPRSPLERLEKVSWSFSTADTSAKRETNTLG